MLINISEQNTIKYKLINTLQSAVSSVDYISSLFLKTVCLALNFFHTLYCSYSLPSLFFSFYRWTYKLDPCFNGEHKGLGEGRGLASKKTPNPWCLFHSLYMSCSFRFWLRKYFKLVNGLLWLYNFLLK